MREKVDKILEWVLIFLISILVIDVLWQVVSRYILINPSSFTTEVAGYLLIWVGILGAAYVAGKNEHLAIDLLLQKSPHKRRLRLLISIYIFILLFSFSVMIVGGSWLVYTRFILDVRSADLQLPLGYVYLVVPVSGILIAYYEIDNMIQAYRNK
ncbi:MAG TPA: TRAP transporter small permease [Bacteroidetes bacterium]|nr:TRAP transporter small permease [Bacteroidota bacterium]